ncbi:hypothetical protein EVAR_8873_1 [Eumeta japonica]|uniref:Uncharacterized protein n=1 Tax=Eumeta variegata TaxID=151549 RepID=A0A4C1U054_EUMVA|nr:hypothetical protein EVAR_8873_1 [Eumeta japonica]
MKLESFCIPAATRVSDDFEGANRAKRILLYSSNQITSRAVVDQLLRAPHRSRKCTRRKVDATRVTWKRLIMLSHCTVYGSRCRSLYYSTRYYTTCYAITEYSNDIKQVIRFVADNGGHCRYKFLVILCEELPSRHVTHNLSLDWTRWDGAPVSSGTNNPTTHFHLGSDAAFDILK